MNKIVLPGTDIVISRLGFGTASLHHIAGEHQRAELLAAAVDIGFNHFDTAPYYGFGLAEQSLGRFLSSRSRDITVASKIGLYPPGGLRSKQGLVWLRKGIGKFIPTVSRPLVDWTIDRADKSLADTLRLLRRDCLDMLFLHEPNPALLATDELLEWLFKQREQGKIRAWGMAGPASLFAPLINQRHKLTSVLQVRDSLGQKEAEVVLTAGRPLQLTYGYLSNARKTMSDFSASRVVKEALKRNSTGTVIVSSRKTGKLVELAAEAKNG